MKYGIAIDNRTKQPVNNYVKEFSDEHWENIVKSAKPSWIPFPKEKVFISFNEHDRGRMKILKDRINTSELVESLVVEENRKGNELLTKLVTDDLEICHFFVVILSEVSIKEQWVNQEIGYAASKENVEIIPIVQNSAVSSLKGFIHRQSHLTYKFHIKDVPRTDNSQFGKVSNEVLKYLESKVRLKHKFIK